MPLLTAGPNGNPSAPTLLLPAHPGNPGLLGFAAHTTEPHLWVYRNYKLLYDDDFRVWRYHIACMLAYLPSFSLDKTTIQWKCRCKEA
jgi:hypothetical protein